MRELDPLTFLIAESLFGTPKTGMPKPITPKPGTPTAFPAELQPVGHALASTDGACLVLLAHGSKDPRWRAPFERIAQELRHELGQRKVRLAYMEFVGPTLMDVAQECVGQSLLNLRVLPLFMAVGAHLAKDIPEQVAEVRGRYPQLTVEVLPPVGEDIRVMQLLEQIALEAACQSRESLKFSPNP